MKTAIFALIACLFVVSTAAKRCGSSDDCEEDECCVTHAPLGLLKGTCKSLSEEGEMCHDEDDEINGKFHFFCPCQTGLTCEAKRVKDLGIFGKLKIKQKCVSEPGTTTTEPQTEVPEETDAPVETEAPVEETEAPVEDTEAPVEETEAPDEETEAPAEE